MQYVRGQVYGGTEPWYDQPCSVQASPVAEVKVPECGTPCLRAKFNPDVCHPRQGPAIQVGSLVRDIPIRQSNPANTQQHQPAPTDTQRHSSPTPGAPLVRPPPETILTQLNQTDAPPPSFTHSACDWRSVLFVTSSLSTSCTYLRRSASASLDLPFAVFPSGRLRAGTLSSTGCSLEACFAAVPCLPRKG